MPIWDDECYAGVDFVLAPDGSVMPFEANATMEVVPPGADPMGDYRRGAITDAIHATLRMLLRRVDGV